MSVRVMAMVWDADFPSMASKLVALNLADHSNDDGENIYPTVARLEDFCGISESAVREALADMEAAGLLFQTGLKADDRRPPRPGRARPIRAFDLEKLEALNRKRSTLQWVRVEVPVHDLKSGNPKTNTDGSPKMRPAWRLVPIGESGVQPADPGGSSQRTPGGPASGPRGVQPADPGGPASGPPSAVQPSFEPSTHPSDRRVRASGSTLLEDLEAEAKHPHVVEHFIRPLVGALRFDGRDDPGTLVRAIRDQLAPFADKALADAAQTLLRSRSVWPSAAKALEAVQEAQKRHLVRIVPGSPQWSAWSAEWRANGAEFLVRRYEADGFAMVTREFPVRNGGRR